MKRTQTPKLVAIVSVLDRYDAPILLRGASFFQRRNEDKSNITGEHG